MAPSTPLNLKNADVRAPQPHPRILRAFQISNNISNRIEAVQPDNASPDGTSFSKRLRVSSAAWHETAPGLVQERLMWLKLSQSYDDWPTQISRRELGLVMGSVKYRGTTEMRCFWR